MDTSKLPNLTTLNTEKGQRKKLKTARNRLNGNGRKNRADESVSRPVELSKIVKDKEVEPINMEYLNRVLGRKKIENETKEKIISYVNDVINSNDSSIAEHFRNTVIDVFDSLYGGTKVSFEDYLNACLFCTYRAAGDNKTKAYAKTFPERVMRMEREGQPMEFLSTYADIYSRGKAVVDIQAKMILPNHILFQDMNFQAMRVAGEIMMDVKVSPKVRIEAANIILNHSKQPEIKKHALEIELKNTDEISQLHDAIYNLSKKQKEAIEMSMSSDGTYTIENVIKQEIYIEQENS